MSRLKRPSHSTVAAYLALFIALGGGSFAIAALSGKEKKVVKKLTNAQITKRAPGLAVATANSAANADKLDGQDASDFAARAYGRVSEVGIESRTKNVVDVTHPDTGIWCIQLSAGIDMSTTVAVVGPDSSDNETSTGSSAVESYVEWVSGGTDCPSDQIQVFTYLYDGDGTDNTTEGTSQPGDNLRVDDEPFSFVVP